MSKNLKSLGSEEGKKEKKEGRDFVQVMYMPLSHMVDLAWLGGKWLTPS